MAALLLMLLPLASSAHAGARITEKTEYYDISGKTGVELFLDMNRRGPRHGFLTKAIAQTRYETKPEGKLVHDKGVCRVKGGGVTMKITYIYPKPRGTLDKDLARRWKLFQADNVRHEKTHGRIARELATEVDGFVRGYAVKDGPSCWKALSRFQREIKELYARNKKKQAAFDLKEHRKGGAVERSVLVLVGKR
jgi:predicted secreted Zn-dependent protease